MKTYKFELTEEQIDKYGLRELVPFTGWAKRKEKINKSFLVYFEENTLKYGIDSWGKWNDSFFNCEYNSTNYIKATPEEIEKGLIEMAEKMGFKEGVRFNTIKTDIAICDKNAYVDKSGIHFHDNCIYSTNGVIYLQGKWATIIPDTKKMTIEEIQKELGYKIKIVE